jgi:DNA-directed RNA polymerase specialized sigma24 family protein
MQKALRSGPTTETGPVRNSLQIVPAPTDKWLIAESLAGDVEAFGLLFTKHREKVLAIVHRHIRHRGDVDDLVQTIWAQVARKLATFKGTAPFEHWLARVAIRICYARLKEHQSNPEVCFTDLGNSDRLRLGLEVQIDD